MSAALLSLNGFAIEALDRRLGAVGDTLFDDATFLVRWVVVDTGAGPRGRVVLLHPSVIVRLDRTGRRVQVRLTASEIEHSPDILLDEPVSRQIEYGERNRTDWEPALGTPRFVAGFWGGMGVQVAQSRLDEETAMHKPIRGGGPTDAGDPHLRSVTAILGSAVHAADGPIGHIWNVLIDADAWHLRAIVVETHHWWPGTRLVLPVAAIGAISWPHREVRLNISRETAQRSPAFDPASAV